MVESRCLGGSQSKGGKMLLPFSITTRGAKSGERAVKLDFVNRSSQHRSALNSPEWCSSALSEPMPRNSTWP